MQCEWLHTRFVLLSVSVLWQAVLPVVAAGTQSNGQKREDSSSRLICTDAIGKSCTIKCMYESLVAVFYINESH